MNSFFKSEPPKRHTILIVDDSPELVELSKTILEMNDYEVYTALSGSQALTMLGKIDQPDLILLDLQMKEMSGPQFLLELEKNNPEIIESVPVVFLSGMDKAPPSCAMGFLQKPVPMDKFLSAIQQFIENGMTPSHCH